jgi:hypothetical protein
MSSGWSVRRAGSTAAVGTEAKSAILAARYEAQRLGHAKVGTQHLLLALADPATGIASRAIRAPDLDLETLRSRVAELREVRLSSPTEQPQLSSQLSSAIDMSRASAAADGDEAVRPHHLLLGLLYVRDSEAARLLAQMGVDLAEVFDRIFVLKDQPFLDDHRLGQATTARRRSQRAFMEMGAKFDLPGWPRDQTVLEPGPAIEMNAKPEVANPEGVVDTASRTAPGQLIFISYRRQDTSGYAGWLHDRLAERFGKAQVFRDVASIELGLDFSEAIEQAFESCQALLVLIGPGWTGATDNQGRRRLDNPDDFVRLEVEAALDRGIRVLPILVDNTLMPRSQDLPESLARLSRHNALRLSHESFDDDVRRLIEALAGILKSPD